MILAAMTEESIDEIVRNTDWLEELTAARRRFSETPRWRFWRRRIHRRACESALWFLHQQEAGRL